MSTSFSMLGRVAMAGVLTPGPIGRLGEVRPPWSPALRFMRAKPLGGMAAFAIVFLVAIALLAPVLAPYDPAAISFARRLAAPSSVHPLGTDFFGRDVLSRILFGAQISLYVGILATSIGVGIGSLLGILSGYIGGHLTACSRASWIS